MVFNLLVVFNLPDTDSKFFCVGDHWNERDDNTIKVIFLKVIDGKKIILIEKLFGKVMSLSSLHVFVHFKCVMLRLETFSLSNIDTNSIKYEQNPKHI